MFITGLTLSGYSRFALSGITYLELTLTEIYQIILGTNGCGKSSLLKELTPFPAHSKRYRKDGYKIFRCEHRGSHYVLTSTFAGGAKHTFEKDGVTLHNQGNATIQRELVKQHFGIDESIQAILTGQKLFTRMSTAERREWLMEFSGNQYDYAMKVYNLLKTKYRDTQGVVKHLNKRLADETEKLPSVATLQSYKEQCAELKNDLDVLLEWRDNSLPSEETVTRRISQLTSELSEICNKIIDADMTAPHGYNPLTSISYHIGKRTAHLSQLQEDLSRLYDTHNELDDTCMRLEEMDVENRDGLLATYDRLRKQRDSVEYNVYGQLSDPRESKMATEVIRDTLLNLLSQLPRIAEDMLLTTPQIKEQIQWMENDLSATKEKFATLTHHVQHIQNSEKTHCPKCKYSWFNGDPQNGIGDMLVQVEILRTAIATKQAALQEHRELLETKIEHNAIFRQISQLMSNNRYLTPLWRDISTMWCGNILAYPITLAFGEWEHAVAISSHVDELDTNLRKIDESLTVLSEDNNKTLSTYAAQRNDCQRNIELVMMQIDMLKIELGLLKRYEETIVGFDNLQKRFMELAAQSDDEHAAIVKIREQESISEFMRSKHSALGSLEHVLSKANIAEGILREMEKQKEEVLLDGEAYACMVKELSPTDGLIADCMKGFITIFAQQMTDIIKNIWTYDLVVLPCKVGEKDELDYRFPLRAGMSLEDADDVSEGSTSQVDVVDFAFRIMTILYLGLEDMPFYLDEPATTMDEAHRSNIILFIKEYVDMRKASQLFLVSHYFQQSGAFHPSETLLLDATNIVNVPGVYNRHAILRKS